MASPFSRRDFLKFGGLSLAGLAFSPVSPQFAGFDDSDVVRVATNSVSVYSLPTYDLKKASITGTWYKDDLVHVYEQVTADEPTYNPIWYRVWGGYMHRAHLQRVKTILNEPLGAIPESRRLLAEVTVPFAEPWWKTSAGWHTLDFRLYYQSVYWIQGIEPEGPDGEPWYRIWDDLLSPIPYYAPARFFRIIPTEELTPINPEITDKHIDVNLTTQHLSAYENGKIVFQTNVSSGVPGKTSTSVGKFNIDPKMPSKHMGNGDLFAGLADYELPGIPWCSQFTGDGQFFHGTYWHENFGAPMSHGCINMRTNEAQWIFRWSSPSYNVNDLLDATNARSREVHGLGSSVEIHY